MTMGFEMDTTESGLNAFFKDYQILALKILWETQGATSKEVWLKVNERLEGTISRASIINFLEDMKTRFESSTTKQFEVFGELTISNH